jgi:hypothetical protein
MEYIMTYENPWIYQGKIFETEDIQDFYGFVYVITDILNNKQYIGRKYFWSTRKVKGKKRRQKKESDWKDYYSSSKVINDIYIKYGPNRFKREIISLHKTKGQVNFNETKLLFQKDVLESVDNNGKRLYYNDNILSRYFVPKVLKEGEMK